MALAYRRDIDGLRAVAVLSVVFYHLGMPFEFNGFVGVDIFFVISGYLITGLINQELVAGRFSLLNFYLRRVKRILPALFAMIAVTTLFAILVMLPSDLKDLGKSAFAAVASLSNVYFWYSEDTSYFSRSSDLLPLLHTWSLGVEEQFYLFWPPLLWLAYRFAGNVGTLAVTVAIFAGSLLFSEWLLGASQTFSFFMLPTRAWELLTGSAAYFLIWRNPRNRLPGVFWEVVAAIGLAAIVFSLFSATAGSPFPGFNALYPCLGSALLILSGAYHSTSVARVLSTSAFVAIGLVSYSLYLWHWPVLSFARYFFAELNAPTALACALLFSALSVLSYRYVEVPFRRRKLSTASVFATYVGLPALLLVPLTLGLYFSNGLQQVIAKDADYAAAIADTDLYAKAAFLYDYVCQKDKHSEQTFSGPACVVGAPELQPRALLFGDSHAAHHVGYFAELGIAYSFSLRNLEVGNCPPILGAEVAYLGSRPANQFCSAFRARIADEVANYEVVMLGGIWSSYYAKGTFAGDLRATVQYLLDRDVKVILLGQIPGFPYFDRNCQLRNARFFSIDCEQNASQEVVWYEEPNTFLKSLANEFDGVAYFQMGEAICTAECSPYRDGRPLYYDRSHISVYGGRQIARESALAAPEFLLEWSSRAGMTESDVSAL